MLVTMLTLIIPSTVIHYRTNSQHLIATSMSVVAAGSAITRSTASNSYGKHLIRADEMLYWLVSNSEIPWS